MNSIVALALLTLFLSPSTPLVEGEESTDDICIVGGGIGGAAVAYFSSKKQRIRVFEARDYVGGRLKHIVMDGETIELGGDAWSSANEYVEKIAKDLGINTTSSEPTRLGDPISKNLGVWTGESLLNGEHILFEHGLSDLRGIIDESLFLARLKENYRQRGENEIFNTVDEFLHYGSLNKFTSISSRNYFTSQHIASATQDDLLEPLMRCIYGQGLSAHAFAS